MKFYAFNSYRETCAKYKILLKMRLITILIFIVSLQVSASGLAQKKITLSEKNISLEAVLEKIGKQSGFGIIYNSNLIKTARPISIEVKDGQLLQILAHCFYNQPLGYAIEASTIIVSDKKTVDIIVNGTVKDKSGEPIPGVSISVRGDKGRGTSTDATGKFVLSVPEKVTLVFSAIGYITFEAAVDGRKTIDVVLTEQNTDLNEVVVVGYGTIDKKDLTSAVSSIKPKDFISGSVNPLMSIQGKVPGLTISSSNGTDPNAGLSIQLRGINSINAGQGPLVVIDGVPGGDINSVAREDIESINVLRDASAAAIYGTRASGGVILITTKKAKIGTANVTFTSELFTETIRKRPESLSGDEFVANELGTDFGHRTDWYNEVTNKNPFSQRYVLNANGGSENAQVYATATMRDAKGIAIGSERKEMGGRINTAIGI